MKKIKLDLKSIEADVEISDGYHSFDELYDHRITLYSERYENVRIRQLPVRCFSYFNIDPELIKNER